MELAAVGIAALVVAYLVVNARRNSDPLNRKCAAEICAYLTQEGPVRVDVLRQIFLHNARYKSQAKQVLSMVRSRLKRVGLKGEEAMSRVRLLRAVVSEIPR
jgi:hypothetical protein